MENPDDHPHAPRRQKRFPKFPIRAGKAHQKLSQAIICADHELASWLDWALITGNVTGEEELITALRERLDRVMKPLDANASGDSDEPEAKAE